MLERLTPEQEARLPEFREFGLRIGLSTERTDRAAADDAIRAHYRACGLAEPKEIRWFDSPYASIRWSVWESVRRSVWESVRRSVWESVRRSVGASVGASVRQSVRRSVGASVWESVGASVRQSVWESVGASVGQSVGAYYDADDAAWMLAWDQYGISLPASALTFIKVSEHVWWWWPGKDVVFASDRPTAILRDENGRLHCETGRCIEFADGTGFSAWHGTTIPDQWVAERDTIDPAEVLKCVNVEQRAAGLACIGGEKWWRKVPHKIIDADDDPSHGELIEVRLDGLPDPGRYLRAKCPRNGWIFEGVPNEIDTVLAAQAWRVGLEPHEFTYPTVRT